MAAFWPRSSAPVKLTERFGLTEAADKEVILLSDVERFRKGSQQVANLKKLMSPTPALVDFKNKAPRQVDFSSKVFIMDSNYPLTEIFGKTEFGPMAKRFPVQLPLVTYPCSPDNPLGYTPALLRAEMGQVVLTAVALTIYALPCGPYAAGGGKEGWGETEEDRDWQQLLLDRILQDNPQASFEWLEQCITAEEIQQVLEKSLTVLFQDKQAQATPNSWAGTPPSALPLPSSETHLIYPTNAQWLTAAYGT